MRRRDFLNRSTAVLAVTPSLTWAAEGPLLIRDLYERDDTLSDLAKSNEGNRVTFTGFMAPPLKAEASFFVLTKMPMAVCPFCEPDAEWPTDIIAVYTKRTVRVIPFNVRIEVSGILELGRIVDPETGFMSEVRLADAVYS